MNRHYIIKLDLKEARRLRVTLIQAIKPALFLSIPA